MRKSIDRYHRTGPQRVDQLSSRGPGLLPTVPLGSRLCRHGYRHALKSQRGKYVNILCYRSRPASSKVWEIGERRYCIILLVPVLISA